MARHHEYQVVTFIPEDDEWDEQEIVSGPLGLREAEADVLRPIPAHFPEGTKRYIEVRSYTDWERL